MPSITHHRNFPDRRVLIVAGTVIGLIALQVVVRAAVLYGKSALTTT